jgi:molybdate transport system regulatory protein
VRIKHKIWLEKEGKVVFGKGREELLKAIEEYRSLNAAAKKMKMSYRAAWARLKASEQRAGMKLVESDGQGKGLHLTSEARELLTRFMILEKETQALIEKFNSRFSLQKIKPRKTGK